MSERRHSPRLPVSLPVFMTVAGRCREERLVDASDGGLRLQSDARLRVGQAVKIFVPLRDTRGRARTALVKATVARAIGGPRGARGYGVRFEAGVRDTRSLLATHLLHSGAP